MFGAYQAGAWKALEGRFRPDVVIGASAGAVNGWAIAGGAAGEELIRLWLDPEMSRLARTRLAQPPWNGIFDSRPLHQRIQQIWSSYRPRTEVGVTATDLLRLRPHLFRNEEIGWEHLAASCAVLACYAQVRIGGRWYTDGGLLSVLPLWAAPCMGASRVIAINALPLVPSFTVRTLVRALRAAARRNLPVPPGLDVTVISPSRPLGSVRDAVMWNPDAAARWIGEGEKDAIRILCGRTEAGLPAAPL
jgi:predicted acylesterase/phospholipase RssA